MICSAIHDLLDDAQRHYQIEHIDDNDNDCKNSSNLHNSNQQLVLDEDEDEEDELNSMTYELPVSLSDGTPIYDETIGHNQSTSNSVTVSVPASLRQLQYQSLSSHQNSDSLISSQQYKEQPPERFQNKPKPITFAQPSNSFLLPFGGSTGLI